VETVAIPRLRSGTTQKESMIAQLVERKGHRMLVVEPRGALLGKTRDVLDLVEEGLQQKVRVIVLPAARLDPAFFQLRSGVAGEFVQKIVNYRFKLAVIGDISTHVAQSKSLGDFVRECNRGSSILFVPDIDALEAKLSAGS